MTDDTKILSAIKALHERFVEEPTDGRSGHIRCFIEGSKLDMEPPSLSKLLAYDNALRMTELDRFSSRSIAHLNEVAGEIFKEIAA